MSPWDKEAAKTIINLLRREYEQAEYNHRQAYAERVGMDAAANVWDDFNKENGAGSFSQNPYDSLTYSQKEERAKLAAAKMKAAYELAINTFLDMTKE